MHKAEAFEIIIAEFNRLNATHHPVEFLERQQTLYSSTIIDALREKEIQTTDFHGLPTEDATWYINQNEYRISPITHLKPRVINIGSGPEARRLAAVNIDISASGNPDIVGDAAHLDQYLESRSATLIRASHVLEHFRPEDITRVLRTWKEVLHANGELHVAVPDWDVVSREIRDGVTPKGDAALPLDKPSSAVLTQIYGLGHQSSDTHPAWLHHLLFRDDLLSHMLKESGFEEVVRRQRRDDLAAYCGVDDDSQNHYTLSLTGRTSQKRPHPNHPLITPAEFIDRVNASRDARLGNRPVSYVIPVRNEKDNLARLIGNLHHQPNPLNTPREFVFVINDTSDESESIIKQYADGALLSKTIHSEPGIVKAFYAGIQSRNLEGYVGKLDADCLPEPGSLCLLEMFLENNPGVFATYSEPKPLDARRQHNVDDHDPTMRTKRLYIHGKNSLYRDNPFAQLVGTDRILEGVKVEDMFLSFYLAYYFGLDAIQQAPGAFVGCRTIATMHDLQNQIGRAHHELNRVFDVFPPFKAISNILQRDILHEPLKRLRDKAFIKASKNGNGRHGWTMIGSTK
jgi:predicted SAM-dependent methyltransferase/glycosyltransferase involved in cell wall biosynthesis